jgi:hypothetical protein
MSIPRAVSERRGGKDADARDRAAARRNVDAGVRDRMADDDMPDAERDARRHAAQDRMAAMRDRQAAARDRERADGSGDAQAARDRERAAHDGGGEAPPAEH